MSVKQIHDTRAELQQNRFISLNFVTNTTCSKIEIFPNNCLLLKQQLKGISLAFLWFMKLVVQSTVGSATTGNRTRLFFFSGVNRFTEI